MSVLSSRNSFLMAADDSRSSAMQRQLTQLQEELKNEQKEKSRTLAELAAFKIDAREKARLLATLEKELDDANRVRAVMAVTLTEQKVELEEAKKEIASLRERPKSSPSSWLFNGRAGGSSGKRAQSRLEKSRSMGISLAPPPDVHALQRELKQAVAAEEKSKKAMDGLAAALKEVADDARDAKQKLAAAQEELKNIKSENARLKTAAAAATEAAERARVESGDASAAWAEKERGLMKCIEMFEEEIERQKKETAEKTEAARAAKEESLRLRDVLRHAVSEADVVKESLEIARAENSQLKDLLNEKKVALPDESRSAAH